MVEHVLRGYLRERPARGHRPRPDDAASIVVREPGTGEAYRLDVLQSIHDADACEWDAVAGPAAVTRSHAYLAAVEAAGVAGCRYFYFQVRDTGGRLAAHACVYLVETDFAQLLPAWLETCVRRLRRWWPRLARARVTECAVPLASGCSVSVREPGDRARVVRLVEAGMRKLAEREQSRLLVLRDFGADAEGELDFLEHRGYKRVSNLPLARIRITWPSYEAYLDAMRGRYRKDLRRRLRRAHRAGHRVRRLERFGDDASRWAEQALAIHAGTRGFKREAVNAAYYAAMDALPETDRLLAVVEDDGEDIAHGLVLFDAENTIATFFGRRAGPAAGEWFELIDEVVRIGIERGSRTINLGLGSYDAKSLVGAEFEALYVYTRCTRPWLNFLIRLVPDLMRREPRERHVFRDARGT